MLYQISSGQGPAECELGVAKLLKFLTEHYDISVIDTSSGYNEGTYRSVRFYSADDLSEFLGSVQWVCKSPYRPAHKRKNWFIDFSECAVAQTKEFDPEQVVFDTFRSGGKGGQNVNKVETGVRAIYVPTGQAVVCTEERNQHTNKRKALERLQSLLEEENRQNQAESKNENWRAHTRIVRGNARICFSGLDFCQVEKNA
ncbi:MAG: peptide chain release factor H [bacterium]|nr:peptide chain release factor H [bacterium]